MVRGTSIRTYPHMPTYTQEAIIRTYPHMPTYTQEAIEGRGSLLLLSLHDLERPEDGAVGTSIINLRPGSDMAGTYRLLREDGLTVIPGDRNGTAEPEASLSLKILYAFERPGHPRLANDPRWV